MTTCPTYDPSWSYPETDGPYFEEWGRRFEAIFVWLHPFFKVEGIEPAYQRLRLSDLAGRKVHLINRTQVGQAAGLPEPYTESTEVALATSIGALKREFRRPEWTVSVASWAERTGVFWPHDDVVNIAMMKSVAALGNLSGEGQWIRQNWIRNNEAHYVDFCTDELENLFGHEDCFFRRDPDLLLATGFDHHFTVVAGPSRLLKTWVNQEGLDGFFADQATTDHWFTSITKSMNSEDAEQ